VYRDPTMGNTLGVPGGGPAMTDASMGVDSSFMTDLSHLVPSTYQASQESKTIDLSGGADLPATGGPAVPSWLNTAGGGGAGGGIASMVSDMKDCVCSADYASGSSPDFESPANFRHQNVTDARETDRANPRKDDSSGNGEDLALKIETLTSELSRLSSLPDDMGEAVRVAIETAFANLGNNEGSPTSSTTSSTTSTVTESGQVSGDHTVTVSFDESLKVDHSNMSVTGAVANLEARIKEIVENVLKEQGVSTSVTPVSEGGITPTDK
jgi:hypothetical protein